MIRGVCRSAETASTVRLPQPYAHPSRRRIQIVDCRTRPLDQRDCWFIVRSPHVAAGVFILIALATIVWNGAKPISLRHHARLLKFVQFAGVWAGFGWKRSLSLLMARLHVLVSGGTAGGQQKCNRWKPSRLHFAFRSFTPGPSLSTWRQIRDERTRRAPQSGHRGRLSIVDGAIANSGRWRIKPERNSSDSDDGRHSQKYNRDDHGCLWIASGVRPASRPVEPYSLDNECVVLMNYFFACCRFARVAFARRSYSQISAREHDDGERAVSEAVVRGARRIRRPEGRSPQVGPNSRPLVSRATTFSRDIGIVAEPPSGRLITTRPRSISMMLETLSGLMAIRWPPSWVNMGYVAIAWFLAVRVEYATGFPVLTDTALREHAAFVSTLPQRRIERARSPLGALTRPKSLSQPAFYYYFE